MVALGNVQQTNEEMLEAPVNEPLSIATSLDRNETPGCDYTGRWRFLQILPPFPIPPAPLPFRHRNRVC